MYPLIVPGKRLKCTCTLKWLQLYSHLFEEKINTTRDYELFVNTRHYGHDILEYDEITYVFCDQVECDFENIFNKCTLIESSISRTSSGRHLSDVDVYLTIKWFQYILLTILKVNLFLFKRLFSQYKVMTLTLLDLVTCGTSLNKIEAN